MNSFERNLSQGKQGESLIMDWLKENGLAVLPICDISPKNNKGPRLFQSAHDIITPDIIIFGDGKVYWIEVKNKSAFTWHRKTNHWVTGIDLNNYFHYLEINKETQVPVWLLFLQRGGQAKDSPNESPQGLFGNKLEYLKDNENHRSDKWGKGGMVYWSIEDLKLLAKLKNSQIISIPNLDIKSIFYSIEGPIYNIRNQDPGIIYSRTWYKAQGVVNIKSKSKREI